MQSESILRQICCAEEVCYFFELVEVIDGKLSVGQIWITEQLRRPVPFHERVNRGKSYLAIDAYNSKAGIGSVWGM
jgi:hypothetical protein